MNTTIPVGTAGKTVDGVFKPNGYVANDWVLVFHSNNDNLLNPATITGVPTETSIGRIAVTGPYTKLRFVLSANGGNSLLDIVTDNWQAGVDFWANKNTTTDVIENAGTTTWVEQPNNTVTVAHNKTYNAFYNTTPAHHYLIEHTRGSVNGTVFWGSYGAVLGDTPASTSNNLATDYIKVYLA